MTGSPTRELIKNSLKRSFFWSVIRKTRTKEAERRKTSFKWEGKIYPSSPPLKFTMCPHKYFQDIEKPRVFELEGIYRMEAGTYKHSELQACLLQSGGLYDKPQNLSSALEAKLLKNWPEVPFLLEPLGLSGRLDGVLKIQDRPVVLEFKTTSKAEKTWAELSAKAEHKCQIAIYMYVLNKLKYYDKPIEKGILAYLNMQMPVSDPDAEKEFIISYTDELEKQVELLLEHLQLEKDQYLLKVPSSCTYPACWEHRKKNKKGKAND